MKKLRNIKPGQRKKERREKAAALEAQANSKKGDRRWLKRMAAALGLIVLDAPE